ncbi:unnamed protein product [Adineta ricciae]|uniref:Uncharacterized protein n=1 Tax=Adineta ricciae TaxID=249248 RepID=A0A815VLN9_ADIRI|nr:unnamed protein product [Adineta ricciae]
MTDNNDYKLSLFSGPRKNDWTRTVREGLDIRRRTCTTFIPEKSKGEDRNNRSEIRCGCKRLRREHSSENIVDGNETVWDKTKHTKAEDNNAYGYLPTTRAYFIRCDIETEPKVLAQFVFEAWRIKPPRLIMSIVGGAKYFKLSERLEREFIKGIIQAALKADGWIVTTGFKTGVVQLVGEAIHDHKVTNPRSHITAIGCSKWGAVRNREALILKTSMVNRCADVATKAEKGQQHLEPNHTHFLLLDDGTYYGYEIGDYRTRFVNEIAKYKDANVPNVTIVVEGGPDTLLTIYNDLCNNIPVVLIDGSGRVPNLLATFLKRTEGISSRKDDDSTNWDEIVDIGQSENLFDQYEDEIRLGLKDISKGSKSSEETINHLFKCFLFCLQPAIRCKIQVYSLDGDHDLDDTIFVAIIQTKQRESLKTKSGLNREQLLQLALAWDAIEVAKQHIIKDDLNDLSPETKEKLFFEALILDRPQFVHVFIKLNFNLRDMFYERQINNPWRLKWDKLARLYNDNEKKQKERLYLLEKCSGKAHVESEHDLDRVLRKLVGDYVKPMYTRDSLSFFERLKSCCQRPNVARVGDSRANLYVNNDSEIPDPEDAQKEVRELVFRDLFLWSILTNRIEISKVLLNHMETRICGLLIASKIFRSYLHFASDTESKEVLSNQAKQFEEYASECLKCCYNFDEEKACEIAIRRINVYGGVSCLQVAVDADDKNFVGQPCCDQLMNSIWFDKIVPFRSTLSDRLRFILAISTFGLLAQFIIPFRTEQELSKHDFEDHNQQKQLKINQEDDSKDEIKPSKPYRLNDYGINYSDHYVWHSDKHSQRYVTYFRHLKHFHESPIVKYSYNIISYIIFLLLFSYYLLFNFNIPTDNVPSIHWTEILVIIIITTMLFEEIRQFLCQDNRSMIGKLSNTFIINPFYNVIRVISYLLFYIGLILRFTNTSSDESFSAAKIILAYDLEVWFIRSLTFLSISQKMGPKLIIDLFFFTYIILIAMIAYGVVSRTMYTYNNETVLFNGRSIFRNIIYPVYYLMYGNVGDELTALDENQSAGTAIATHVLLAFHMLFVNILLINLLIAMFSFTFNSVQDQTDLVWRYERYSLIREYFDRPPLFPPLIIITHIIELVRLCHRHAKKRSNQTHAKIFKMIAAHRQVDKDWSEFESYSTNLYLRSLLTDQPLSASALLPSPVRTDQQSSSDASTNNAQYQTNASYLDFKAINDDMVSVRKTILDLRTCAQEMNRCMAWMMDAMDRVKMSKDPKPYVKSNNMNSSD